MIPTHYLHWFFEGQWHEIGWPATGHKSKADLFAHGAHLAALHPDELYRIVILGLRAADPVTVVFDFNDERSAA